MPARGDFNLDPNVLRDFSLDLTPEMEPLRQVRQFIPVAPVSKADFKYQVHQNTWFTEEDEDIRPPGAKPREVDYSLTSGNDTADEHALSHKVTDEQIRDSDDVLDPVEDGVAFLRYKILLRQIRTIANALGTQGNYVASNRTQLAGANQWSDLNASDPLGDVETGKEAIRSTYGIDSSMLTLVLPAAVFSKLRQNSQIRSAYGGGWAEVLNPSTADLAAAFGLRNVVVVNGVYNSANPGQAVSMGDIFGKHAWLMHVPTTTGVLARRQRAFAATFTVDDPSQGPQDDDYISWDVVERDTSEGKLRKARWAIASMTYKFKIIESTLAYFVEDAVA